MTQRSDRILGQETKIGHAAWNLNFSLSSVYVSSCLPTILTIDEISQSIVRLGTLCPCYGCYLITAGDIINLKGEQVERFDLDANVNISISSHLIFGAIDKDLSIRCRQSTSASRRAEVAGEGSCPFQVLPHRGKGCVVIVSACRHTRTSVLFVRSASVSSGRKSNSRDSKFVSCCSFSNVIINKRAEKN